MSEVAKIYPPCFTFLWKIENFSYCVQKIGECLYSPEFSVDILKKTAWKLKVYPRGAKDCGEYVSIFLQRMKSNTEDCKFNVTVDCEMSILSHEGYPKHILEFKKHVFPFDGEDFGFFRYLLRSVVCNKHKSELLPENTLTVQCRMWMVPNILVTGICSARTLIGVDHKSFMWTLLKFSAPTYQENSFSVVSNVPVVQTTEFKICGSTAEDNIDITVSQPNTRKQNFVTFVMSYFKTKGGMGFSTREYHWFEVSDQQQIWTLPCFFTKSQLASNEEIFTSNDKVVLSCEYSISFGVQESQIECLQLQLPDTYYSFSQDLKPEPSICDNGLNDLKVLYEDKTLSDIIVRVGSDVFHVHKTILSARSSVFKAMLTCEMKEKNTDVIDIEDLDSDTVKRLLSYMYTDTIDNLTWEEASKLYFAADKYQLFVLKQFCSKCIKSFICIENACKVLYFADMHQDYDLKDYVQDFIFANIYEVLRSDEWEKFVQEKGALAAITLSVMFSKKMVIVK